MLKYIFTRIASAIPLLLSIVVLTFLLIRLAPGGPFDSERPVPPEVLASLNAHYQLDQPVWKQLKLYLSNLLLGDLGPSYKYANRTVNDVIATGLPVTAELAGYALVIALVVGIGVAVVATRYRGLRLVNMLTDGLSILGVCIPAFVLGPLLILILGIGLGVFPASGWGMSPGDKVLPALTLAFGYIAFISRIAKSAMSEIVQQRYITTAKAKGASDWQVMIKHVLPGALVPVLAYLGPATAGLLAGSFVVETLFQIPGIGRFYIQGAFSRDYTLIMGMTIVFAVLITTLNILSDILAMMIDPKVKDTMT